MCFPFLTSSPINEKRKKNRQLIENKSKHKVADINERERGLRQTLTILLSIVSERIEHFSKLWREIQVNLQYFRWSLRMRMQFMHITYVHNTKDIDIDAGTFNRYKHTHTHHIFLSRFFRFLFCALFFFHLFKFWAKKNSIVECAFFVLFSIKWKQKLHTQSEYLIWFLNGKIELKQHLLSYKLERQREFNEIYEILAWNKTKRALILSPCISQIHTHTRTYTHRELVLQRPWINFVGNFYDAYWNWYTKLFIT